MKVLLVDDHPLMREATRGLLEHAMSGVRVVGEAANPEEGAELAGDRRPDLVVLDLLFGGVPSGIELCRDLKAMPDPPLVVVYTAYSSFFDVTGSKLAGADSYVTKDADPEKLLEAVRGTAAGDQLWLMGQNDPDARRLEQRMKSVNITRREADLLPLIARGKSNREIADELNLSVSTVKEHVGSILKKLGVESRRDISHVHRA